MRKNKPWLILVAFVISTSAQAAAPPTIAHVPLRTKIRYGFLKAKAALVDFGAKMVGVAEMVGLRYPVKAYEHEVSKQLWRGSRLDDAAILDLKSRGFSAVVSLTKESDSDDVPAARAGLAYKHIPILDNTAPTTAQVKDFLDFVAKNGEAGPVYVHCEAGVGRTGVMVAAYRMAFEGMSAGDVLRMPTEGDAPSRNPKEWGLSLPSQRAFVRQFYRDLVAGKVAGYPRKDVHAEFGVAPTNTQVR